ncbi:uncharacterized protein [Ambystoma mexicanum]|uniref:uncharacterized protein n=1 Tax=Ambystoma mexicanum TaxID=8296 RepID=UPI0037E96E3A
MSFWRKDTPAYSYNYDKNKAIPPKRWGSTNTSTPRREADSAPTSGQQSCEERREGSAAGQPENKMENVPVLTTQHLDQMCKDNGIEISSKKRTKDQIIGPLRCHEEVQDTAREVASAGSSTEVLNNVDPNMVPQRMGMGSPSKVCHDDNPTAPSNTSELFSDKCNDTSLELMKLKLECIQKQCELKEKLAHERAMHETELRERLAHERAMQKLSDEKELALERLRRESHCFSINRDMVLFDDPLEKNIQAEIPNENSIRHSKDKIHELIAELKDLKDDDTPETLAHVEVLINLVKLHKTMIGSKKVLPKIALPTELTTEKPDPKPDINATPKPATVDKKTECEVQATPWTSLPQPLSAEPTSITQKRSMHAPPVIRIITLRIHVAGQAFGSAQQFLNQLESHLEKSEIYLQKEDFDPTSSGLLLLFCPVVSRAGTDINNALEKVSALAKVILVVMNHVPNESMTVYLDSKSQVQRSFVIHTVDCRFSERSGLYSSKMNDEAVLSVGRKIQQEATLQ